MLNPHCNYSDVRTKHLQVIFLGLCEKMPVKRIAEITCYAVSTVKRYLNKFKSLLDESKTIFFSEVEIISECDLLNKATEKCYLFKFYNDKSEIIFSKVGTTTRKVKTRVKEEIRSYRKNAVDVYKVVICSVFDCGELPAEGAESITRAEFIRQYPNTFKKNDRFMNIDIPTENFNKIVNSYLKR